MSSTKISVIIPVYGVEKYIERFARSLFEQTLTEKVEFIFVNDCTPDNSIIILQNTIEKYPKIEEQVKIINNPVNSGQSPSRNNGIKASKGEYIICLDSDDWVEPTMLEDMYNKAITDNCDVVIVDYFVNTNKKQICISQKPEKLDGLNCANQILNNTLHGSWWNKLFKRNLVVNSNIIEPQLGMNMMEDLMVTTQLLFHSKKVGYVDKAYYHYCIRGGSVSQTASEQKLRSFLYAYTFIENFFKAQKISTIESLNALRNLRISTLSGVALDGYNMNLVDYAKYKELRPFIKRHPKLSISYKLALWLQISNLKPLVRLLVLIRKSLR